MERITFTLTHNEFIKSLVAIQEIARENLKNLEGRPFNPSLDMFPAPSTIGSSTFVYKLKSDLTFETFHTIDDIPLSPALIDRLLLISIFTQLFETPILSNYLVFTDLNLKEATYIRLHTNRNNEQGRWDVELDLE